MDVMSEQLWDILKDKVEKEDEGLQADQKIGNQYLASIEKICKFGTDRAKTIQQTFPLYTLHDETHIRNILRLFLSLLGDRSEELTRDETAMLLLSACCHDIGMSYSEDDKALLLADIDRLDRYLDVNPSEYVKAYANGNDRPQMSDDMMQTYLRSIHHERVMDILSNYDWPVVLNGKVNRDDVIRVCQSHGNDISALDNLEPTETVDLRFCAVLLRLSDILDFDTARAPQALYDYWGFTGKESGSALISKQEWDKHLSSIGFDFSSVFDRSSAYLLPYSANCKSMQVEQAINIYLDWVDQELNNCGKEIKRFSGRQWLGGSWADIVLPMKIKRAITPDGYVSGQYRLTLDQDKIMELFIGNDLYSDPSVFVRELIQNAIDAVRTREQLDKEIPRSWRPQINIRTWMDDEGYHWFRIEDNGIGMTEETIMNYFLKVGCSYYNSDAFNQDKIRCNADPDYTPISRFGIGILSCFMGGEKTNQVEVSTKRFTENRTYYPSLRLSMHGMSGYYYLANKDKSHMPGPMKGVTAEEKEPYLKQAGTVIAVRTNLYQTGKYRGFKEIVDRYVVFPQVPIHYDGAEGSFDYKTESEFMDAIHNIQPSNDLSDKGLFEFPLTAEQLDEIYADRPELPFDDPPKVVLKCFALSDYTVSQYLTGAVLAVKAVGEYKSIIISQDDSAFNASVEIGLDINEELNEIGLNISLSFSRDLEEKMRQINDKIKSIRQIEKHYNLKPLYDNDKYKHEIVDALIKNCSDNSDWIDFMIRNYNVSLDDLNYDIDKIEHYFYILLGFDKPSKADIETFRAFESVKSNWSFKLCRLSEYDWFTSYFQNIRSKTGLTSITAHNGIYCGDAEFFVSGDSRYEESTNLGTILLLKDNYRPDVDIARDSIRELNLETASDLAIITEQIANHGFKLKQNHIFDDKYPFLSMKNYWTVLDKRPDFFKSILIHTKVRINSIEDIVYSIDDFRSIINEQQEIMLSRIPTLKGTFSSIYGSLLYLYLSLALLRKEFSLYIDLEITSPKVYVSAKKNETLDNELQFPPTFFIPPKEPDCLYLTNKDSWQRYACNADHRFSVWLLKNCVALKERVPGLFNEFMRTLAEENDNNLINGINDLLKRTRDFPGSVFTVSDDLFLTDSDLC